MKRKMVVRQSLSAFWLVTTYCLVSVRGQNCLGGRHHLKTAQAGGPDFGGACANYKTKACCKTNTSENIDLYIYKQLYKFHHDYCGALSKECEAYLKAQACLYDCDPYIVPWEVPAGSGVILRLPACAADCQAMFQACKHDRLCQPRFGDAYNEIFQTGLDYHCPVNYTCKTFAEWYGNAKTMCETQWPDAYTEGPNCITTTYSLSQEKLNPNACVIPPGKSSPIHPQDCNAYRLHGMSSADRFFQTAHLARLVSSVTLLSIWLS